MKLRGYFKKAISVFISLLLYIGFYISSGGALAFAAEPVYSNALNDLLKDPDFNVTEYPYDPTDNSLQVIQIAEGSENELYIYVYQPSAGIRELTATSVNMSLSNNISDTQLYNLTFCNSAGVFQKYVVNDVTVSEAAKRYYMITSIYRSWNENIDDPPEGDNTVSEVSFEVGKFYTATTNADGTRKYEWQKQNVVTITEKYVGFLQYNDGFKWCQTKNCRSHYVAFSTDWKIDELFEVEISYSGLTYTVQTIVGSTTVKETPFEDVPLVIYATDTGENAADWFLGRKYNWQRIERVTDFLNDPINDLKADVKEQIAGKQWVLRFTETTFQSAGDGYYSYYASNTTISDVSILRLKFLSGVMLYNLGVVDNKQTGSNTPGNNNTDELAGLVEWLSRVLGIPEWLVIVLIVIAALLIVLIILFILSIFFPVILQVLQYIGKGLLWLLKGLWWVISAPFKGIVALVKLIKEKKDGG